MSLQKIVSEEECNLVFLPGMMLAIFSVGLMFLLGRVEVGSGSGIYGLFDLWDVSSSDAWECSH